MDRANARSATVSELMGVCMMSEAGLSGPGVVLVRSSGRTRVMVRSVRAGIHCGSFFFLIGILKIGDTFPQGVYPVGYPEAEGLFEFGLVERRE